ncbi:hypothetical protein ACTHQ1_10425 [Janibacter anophelis]|uniref:hypothetical protein n=1 Tax=Janibacter anophelis TaxID=319054 RepID=UPI003F82155E
MEVHADELVVAGTVRELADESTLVLVGRVVDAEMSDLVADSDDGAGVQMEHLSVEVESMLTGDEARVEGGEVTVRQAATDHGKVPVTNGLPPARIGQCAVFFLAESSKDGVWRLTSTQGRYLIDPEGRLIGAHAHGSGADVIEKIEGMTVAELQAEVG